MSFSLFATFLSGRINRGLEEICSFNFKLNLAGPLKVQFPGLNAPLEMREDMAAISIAEQTEEQLREHQTATRKKLEDERNAGQVY